MPPPQISLLHSDRITYSAPLKTPLTRSHTTSIALSLPALPCKRSVFILTLAVPPPRSSFISDSDTDSVSGSFVAASGDAILASESSTDVMGDRGEVEGRRRLGGGGVGAGGLGDQVVTSA